MSIWVQDADAISSLSEEVLNLVCINKCVKEALSSDRLGISGIKGLGKTYLLKVKRRKLESTSADCLPLYRLCDIVDDTIDINYELDSYLKSIDAWTKLWKFSIGIAILSTDSNKSIRKQICIKDPSLKRFFKDNNCCQASIVLSELLNEGRQELSEILGRSLNFVNYALTRVENATYYFIDKVDQSFSNYTAVFNCKDKDLPRNASFWQYAQYALAKAAYSIYTQNRSIKVYFTIRDEALLDSHLILPDMHRNISALIVSLHYSKDDIRKMFEKYIEYEEDEYLVAPEKQNDDPEAAFFGSNTIETNGQSERVFDFIYRHTMRRPCDLQAICTSLSLLSNSMLSNPTVVVSTVIATSSQIFDSYLSELSRFMSCTRDDLAAVYMSVGGNIVTPELMRLVCAQHHMQPELVRRCNSNCRSCNSLQPFSILYNIGLIGCLKDNSQVFSAQCQ